MTGLDLSNPLRPVLLAAGRSSRIKTLIGQIGPMHRLVDRFVPGETEPMVVATARELLGSGRFISVDYLGEDTVEEAQADATVQAYLSLLTAFGDLPTDPERSRPIEVSLKLSAMGQFLTSSSSGRSGHDIALANARIICGAAAEVGAWVTIDAEDHTTTDSTLAIVRELREDFPELGTVLQAYLKRTEQDCRDLSGPRSRIRLCKGAYQEPASVAFQKKAEVNASYLRCLKILMDGQGYPMVASHDPMIIATAQEYAYDARRGPHEFEFQMLYGIRTDEQRHLTAMGGQLRVYIPFGNQWYGYFMRRLAERPANLVFFLRSLISRG